MDPFSPSGVVEQDLPLEKYWEVIKKRRYVLIAFVLFTFLIILVPVFRQTPVFQATGIIMIDRETSNPSLFQDFYAMQSFMMDDYFNSQIQILKSRSLARTALEDLSLLQPRPDRRENGSLLNIFKKNVEPAAEVTQVSGMIDSFLGSLTVSPIKETRLVQVSCRSASPQMAARSVNTLFAKFIEFNLKIKTESTRLASEFLSAQIDELRQTLTQKEREQQQFGEKKDLYYLSSQESTVVDKFSDVNKAYTAAQIERINKEAAYRELKAKDFENYPEVRNNAIILNLKNEYTRIETEYKKKSQTFQDSYPEMQRLKKQMDNLLQRINSETVDIARKALSAAESDYQSALKRESGLSGMLSEQKKNVVSTNTNAIYYNSLKIEVENMRSLLDYLVKKQKESLLTSRLEGLQTSNIKIVDLAEVPQSPLSNSKRRALLIALIFGLGGGVALVFGLDYLDRTLSTPEDIERYLHLPSLGMIPNIGSPARNSYYAHYGERRAKKDDKEIKEIELANYQHPESSYAEHYRNIRTSILLSTPKAPPKIIVVTSSLPSEGKTVTTINLAVAFAQLGKRVLVADMDLRKPRIHKIFKIKNIEGATSFLIGKSPLEKVVGKTVVPGLFILPSGPIPPNPVELLNSDQLKKMLHTLAENFDIIFLDSPPLVSIVDPVLLGKESDGILLVTWGGKTNRKVVEKTKNEFEKYNIRILGVILNRLSKRHHSSYYSSYGYQYGSGYQYGKGEIPRP